MLLNLGYLAELRESVVRILEGLDSHVLPRSAELRSLSSDDACPDKHTVVNAVKSRFKN